MFGSLGITELVLILVIVLIVFGAGKLPKIGEGMGKALKSFKKEIHEAEPIPPSPEQAQAVDAQVVTGAPQPVTPPAPAGQPTPQPTTQTPTQAAAPGPSPVPPQMGPALTPGTTAYMVAQQAWKPVTPPPVAPPPPASVPGSPASGTPAPTHPEGFKAVVNKSAVQRVMAQQAAMKGKNEPTTPDLLSTDRQAMEAAGMQPPPPSPAAKKPAGKMPTPQDLQNLGSGLGDALRTFREAANDVRRAVDPQMHTIKAEIEAAQKEIQSSIDHVKEGPKVEEPPPKT
jgi:TatA/E family protein of Tat protein translocase